VQRNARQNILIMMKPSLFALIVLSISACTEVSENIQPWNIGGDHGVAKVIVDLDSAKNIKICSDKYKNIGFATNINIDYDDKTYFRLIEGLCITIHAKKVRVRFATPSSGKRAEGTFEILDSE